MLAYSNPIAPLPSKDQWISIDKCYVIGPPNTRRPRGRPKKKRIQSKGEDDRSESRISKRVHKCTRCQGYDHHKNTCKQPLRSSGSEEVASSVGAPSRGQYTQRKGKQLPIRGRDVHQFTAYGQPHAHEDTQPHVGTLGLLQFGEGSFAPPSQTQQSQTTPRDAE